MDGWTKTYNSTESFTTPFLFMLSEHGYMPEMQLLFDNNQRTTFRKLIITNANHDSFTDGILLKWPLSLLSKKQATTIRKNINKNIIQFFNTYL